MKYTIILASIFTLFFASCSQELLPTSEYNNESIFNEFWSFVDERYIFFEQKEVDWDQVRQQYASLVTEDLTDAELFDICNQALLELKDNHCRIAAADQSGTSYNIATGYEVHFSSEVIREQYLSDPLQSSGIIQYAKMDNNIGYIYIPDMLRYASLGRVMSQLIDEESKGLIIDVRNNGGGDSNLLPDILGRFVSEPTTLGYYVEKSGPDHDDITAPIEIQAIPQEQDYSHIPIHVIINRRCYSATSYLAAMFGALPQSKLFGQITGGGAGGNYGYQLSNGWVVTVSVSDFLDTEMNSIESGVAPDVQIENTAEDISNGRDRMLEAAIESFDF